MEVTDSALKELAHILETHAAPVTGIRIQGESTSPLKVDFKMSMTQEASVTEEDKVTSFEYEGSAVNIYMDPESQPYSEHLKLDYIQALMGVKEVDRSHDLPSWFVITIKCSNNCVF